MSLFKSAKQKEIDLLKIQNENWRNFADRISKEYDKERKLYQDRIVDLKTDLAILSARRERIDKELIKASRLMERGFSGMDYGRKVNLLQEVIYEIQKINRNK